MTQEHTEEGDVRATALRADSALGRDPGPPLASAPSVDKPGVRRQGGTTTTIAVAIIVVAIVSLSAWYLSRPTPLLIQGEADSTRIDIAARVDGRVGKIPVLRGQYVDRGVLLLSIDNPELIAKYREAVAEK